MIEEFKNLPEVSFIDETTLDDVMDGLVNEYQKAWKEETGHEAKLEPADSVTLILRSIGVYLMHGFEYIERAGHQNLLSTSYGPHLDNLAIYKGTSRLPAEKAETTVRFTLSMLHDSAQPIPLGTRVLAESGQYFQTMEYAEVLPGQWYVDVPCECETAGAFGNGVPPGRISTLVNRLPYIASVSNIEESKGGSDVEDDDSLRERTFLSPSQYSTAGPEDAYIYHTRSYSAAIGSVTAFTPAPGRVIVQFLLKDGSLPTQTLIEHVTEHLNAMVVRPLTDFLLVQAPEIITYDIKAKYYVVRSQADRSVSIQARVAQAVEDFNTWQTSQIGRDINPSELTRRVVEAGAKRVEIESPMFTRVPATSVARLGTCEVTYGGLEDD